MTATQILKQGCFCSQTKSECLSGIFLRILQAITTSPNLILTRPLFYMDEIDFQIK